MKLPEIAIKNHQFTLVVMILAVLFGITSYLNMPQTEDPAITMPGSIIVAIWPGVNPADIESMVAEPIEDAVNELDELKKIDTVIGDGFASIILRFEPAEDGEKKYDEVVDKIAEIRETLPPDLFRLEVRKFTPNDIMVMQVALASETASWADLESAAEALESDFERVPNIQEVKTWAYPEQEVRVSLNTEVMAQKNVLLPQIMGALQSAGQNIPGGSVSMGQRQFTVKTSGSYKSLDRIKNTVVSASGNDLVYLKDIADINLDHATETHRVRFNGERAVLVTVSQKTKANIFTVTEDLNAALDAFKTQLSPEIVAHQAFMQAPSVERRIDGFVNNMLQGIFLVGLVILLVLGFRAAMIAMVAIPVSVFIALGFQNMSGFGVQQMTIVGLVIALGLLVDNAIVVTENVSRFIDQGLSRKDAAIKGARQIGWAVVSSTATTVLAFVPMIVMETEVGRFIRSMPAVVTYALLASMVVSLTLTPYLASKWLKTSEKRSAKNTTRPVQRWMDNFVGGSYRKMLGFALRRPAVILSSALVAFIGTMALFPVVGVSLFPKADKTQFIININTPDGTSLDATDDITAEVEEIIISHPDVKMYTANIGRGNPRVYYNVVSPSESSNISQILVEVDSDNQLDNERVAQDLRVQLHNIPGAQISVDEFLQGSDLEAPVVIKLIGDDLEILKSLAVDVTNIFKNTPGAIDVRNPLETTRTDLRVKINEDKAAMLNLQVADIDQTIRASLAGVPVVNYRDQNGKELPIVLRLPVNENATYADFDHIYLTSKTGAQIPLRQVAEIQFEAGPARITHFNTERSVTITANVALGVNVNEVSDPIIEAMENFDLPAGYRYHVGGEVESREEGFAGMGQVMLIAIIAIFGVLVLQFKSFTQPLIVFTTIPLAIIGSILALLFTGYTFSFTAFVGMTSLIGIVVNNAIILIDYANQLREEGQSVRDAISEAAMTRFTPIMLTTATTVGGLLPLTLAGGSMWAPMGWTIIGGLLMSTVLTLIVSPVLYKIFTREVSNPVVGKFE